MSNLALNSFEVQQYRAFDCLTIPHVGRVNLIVGKNNVGKSSLLEALWLFSQRGRPSVLLDLLRSRDEFPRIYRPTDENDASSKERIWDIRFLFCGREDLRENFKVISMGPVDSPDEKLNLSIRWYAQETDEQGTIHRKLISDSNKRAEGDPYIVTQLGNNGTKIYRLDRVMERRYASLTNADTGAIPSRFIRANGLNTDEVAQLWDNVALTDLEESVVEALHIIAPEVKRLSFLGNQDRSYGRIPVARIGGFSEPVSLRSMGEGMNRILGVALALVNSKNGVLLIDEIESGLHYTVQADIWRLIFQIAHRLNVQVFATTHSWDCIEAFQKAAVEDINEEGLLLRLERKDNEVGATLFNERRLSIATREQIEVR
jgi:AAA15 family ATPase/GTPase